MANFPLPPSQDAQRAHMVTGQLRTSDIHEDSLLAAFFDVPRERFVSPSLAGLAYLDQDQAASGPSGRKLLAPRTLALLLQAAAIQPGERVLDVGGGSGYGSALMAHMGAAVVALETDVGPARAALVDVPGIVFVEGDLAAGAPNQKPFEVILINGAIEKTPGALLDQLAKGGRLVALDARDGVARGVIFEKSAAGYSERGLFDARADVLEAFRVAPSFAF